MTEANFMTFQHYKYQKIMTYSSNCANSSMTAKIYRY